MTGVELVTVGLATWRVARLITREDGPAHLLRRLRIAAGAYETIGGHWRASSSLGELVICPLCASVWTGSALVALWAQVPAARLPIGGLAASAIATLIALRGEPRGCS